MPNSPQNFNLLNHFIWENLNNFLVLDQFKAKLDQIEKRICELDVPDADISGSKAHEWMTVTNDCDGVDK